MAGSSPLWWPYRSARPLRKGEVYFYRHGNINPAVDHLQSEIRRNRMTVERWQLERVASGQQTQRFEFQRILRRCHHTLSVATRRSRSGAKLAQKNHAEAALEQQRQKILHQTQTGAVDVPLHQRGQQIGTDGLHRMP